MKIGILVTGAVCMAAILCGTASGAEFALEFETGALWPGYIDVRVPGDAGTDISFTNDLDASISPYARLRLGLQTSERHRFAIELAPVTVESEGDLDGDVVFAGETFPAGTSVRGKYRFDTYRAAWRYLYPWRGDSRFELGFTLLVRDAAIELVSASDRAEDKNVGLVPLLGFLYERRLGPDWSFIIDGNALAGPQGRAEDVFFGFRRSSSTGPSWSLGYRIVEGGADVEDVYTFALFNHLSVTVSVTY